MATAEALPAIKAGLPGREAQIDRLLELMGRPEDYTLPALFLYGNTATGKTAVVRAVLSGLGHAHAYVNCVEAYSARLLYEQILNQLSGCPPCRDNSYTGYTRCDHLHDFVRHLTEVVDQRGQATTTTYIVLDRAERLRGLHPSVLPALLRLASLMERNVCVVLISCLVWEKFRSGTGGSDPYTIHFPAYSKAQVLAIIARDCPPGIEDSFFRQFVGLLWGVFHGPCRDLNELRHLVALLFDTYHAPVKSGQIDAANVTALYRQFNPHLRKQLSKLYLREASTADWEDAAAGTSKGAFQLELPFHSRYLLIAAYLASYNPSRTDARFFAKRQRSRKRVARRHPGTHRASQQLKGPKTFPLDRLLAIFYSINEAKVDATAEIHQEVRSLVSVGLLRQMSGAANLDTVRYKCQLSLDEAAGLAKTVKFELHKHLYDADL